MSKLYAINIFDMYRYHPNTNYLQCRLIVHVKLPQTKNPSLKVCKQINSCN